MTWIGFWGFFLFASLAAYTVMVVVVGIRAFFDVRRLFGLHDGEGSKDGS